MQSQHTRVAQAVPAYAKLKTVIIAQVTYTPPPWDSIRYVDYVYPDVCIC